MDLFIAIGICFVPALVLSAILLLTVKNLQVWHVLVSFAAGILAIVPIAVLQYVVFKLPIFNTNTLGALLVTAFIFNGLIEETIKMAWICVLPGKKMSCGTFLAAAIIVGFACGTFEVVVYLLNGERQVGLRFLTAVLIHTFCAGLSGLYVWSYKQKTPLLRPFIMAILLHGVYNFFAARSGGFQWFSFVTVAYAAIRVRFSYTQLTTFSNDDTIPNIHDAG